jgi:hypothetical protein
MNSHAKKAQPVNVRAKVLAATLGAGVVVTMGALTVALGDQEASASPPATNGGADSTVQSTPLPTPVVKLASPAVTAKKWHGKDWQGP